MVVFLQLLSWARSQGVARWEQALFLVQAHGMAGPSECKRAAFAKHYFKHVQCSNVFQVWMYPRVTLAPGPLSLSCLILFLTLFLGFYRCLQCLSLRFFESHRMCRQCANATSNRGRCCQLLGAQSGPPLVDQGLERLLHEFHYEFHRFSILFLFLFVAPRTCGTIHDSHT